MLKSPSLYTASPNDSRKTREQKRRIMHKQQALGPTRCCISQNTRNACMSHNNGSFWDMHGKTDKEGQTLFQCVSRVALCTDC